MKITKKPSTVRCFAEAEVRDVTVNDMIVAERIAGKADGISFVAAVLSQVGTFDGVTQPMEVIAEISAADFLELLDATGLTALKESLPPSSPLPEKGASA